MENFNEKLNLLKLSRAGVMQIKGKGEVLRCLVIPVEENHLFVSTDESGKPKAVYLDLTAWAMKNPKYEDSHMIKQSLPKEVRDAMTDEEKNAQPILGSMKPVNFEAHNGASDCTAPFAQSENIDDLPF